jgi:hypothetical protein
MPPFPAGLATTLPQYSPRTGAPGSNGQQVKSVGNLGLLLDETAHFFTRWAAQAVDEDAAIAEVESWLDESPETVERVKSELTEIVRRGESNQGTGARPADANEGAGDTRP